ncbi:MULTISPECIES: site-specific integrase [Acetobacter]|nr:MULTISPECIES: site-specific integrase [Acetobacter]MBC9009283.1 site-specific integrase [Acetobacter tropicalis]MDO8170675.1 site-specific integrase [Acetobacter tropicalis]
MKHPSLTAAALRNIKVPETGSVYLPDGGCPGLRLRISSNGRMAWVLNCRDQEGKSRSVALGDFNGAGCIGLAEARERARRERQKLKDGKDPIAERKAAREEHRAKAKAGTLATLLPLYEQHVVSARQETGGARSWPEAKRAINSVLSKHLHTPLPDLSGPALQRTIDNWPSRARAGATVRFVRPVLKWASRRGLMAHGIAEMLQQPEGANLRRQRVLSDSELAAIWKQLDIMGAYGPAFRWLLWTACRRSEMTRAQWQDIDLETGTWSIPAANAKNGKAHIVPLPRQAIKMLAKMQTNCQPTDLIFPNKAGKPLDNWDRATKHLMTVSETTGWHRHDLRRTCATMLGDLGIMPHIIERVLAHTLSIGGDGSRLSPVAATYNHSSYQAEHGAALQALADRLDAIAYGNVVTLRGQRA